MHRTPPPTRTQRAVLWAKRNKYNLISVGLLLASVGAAMYDNEGSRIRIVDEGGRTWGHMNMRTGKVKMYNNSLLD